MTDPAPTADDRWQRVLVLAPLGRDADVLCQLLTDQAVPAVACGDAAELIAKMGEGFAAVLVAEESLTADAVESLEQLLAKQPVWSDPQFIVLSTQVRLSGRGSQAIMMLRARASAVVLQRPARALTLVTAVHAALRARKRQLQVRDLMEQERTARRQAEAATRLKDEFLATVTHEMRNPLNAILLWSQLLQSGRLTQNEIANAIDAVRRSATAQFRLIEDLLDSSRMVFGKLQLDLQPCELAPILLTAVEMLRLSSEAKQQVLQTSVEPCVGWVPADPPRLQQVICNVLANAIKFTPEHGRIDVLLQTIQGHAQIQVRDTGRGIGADFLPYVFDRFRQGDSNAARAAGGLGLGMAITQRLVELHGGMIQVDSPGEAQGATFTIRLPLLPPVAAAGDDAGEPVGGASTSDPAPLEGMRILLVEDEPDTRAAMGYMLERAGADVTAVGSAAAAIAAVTAESDRARYHVLLSDLGMPGEDGYALVARLRAWERAHCEQRLPAIAVTAYIQDADCVRTGESGFDATLEKPIQLRPMLATIARLARRTE